MNPSDIVLANKRQLLALETQFKTNPTLEMADRVARFAISNRCSVYSLTSLELFYQRIAETIDVDPHFDPVGSEQSRKILHILSRSYLKGGHTRFVERWMASACDSEVHSVFITDQHADHEITPLIRKQVECHQGELVVADKHCSVVARATQLRQIGQKYDLIVLHHHNYDPIPLIAFGTNKFRVPVCIFNHSGHLFWIGASIADHAIDIETGQNQITKKFRGISSTTLINLIAPNKEGISSEAPSEIRRRLGISHDAFVLVSMASDSKYTPSNSLSFQSCLSKILRQNAQAVFLGIGPHPRNPIWKSLQVEFGKRIKLLGSRPFTEVQNYLRIGNLYLDSFPMNSWTSLIDAIALAGLPVVSLRTPVGVLPFLDDSVMVKESAETFIDEVTQLIAHPERCYSLVIDGNQRIKQCEERAFNKNISDIVERMKGMHHEVRKSLPLPDEIHPLDCHLASIKQPGKTRYFGFKSLLGLGISEAGMRSIYFFGRQIPIDY